MLTTALLVSSTALLAWPDVHARRRAARPSTLPRSRFLSGAATVFPGAAMIRYGLIPLAIATGVVSAGVGGGCAVTAAVSLVLWHRKVREKSRSRLRVHAELGGALRLVVAELRTGAPTAVAVEGAAAETGNEIADILRRLAVASRLGGAVSSALTGPPGRSSGGEARAALGRVARAWELAQRHGVELAGLLDAVRRDLDSRVSFSRDVEAKMAGPRATAGVLAALPLLGVLLGEAAGAAPLAVLSGDPIGQVLLTVGVGLLCAGVFWTIRLTESVVRW